MKIVPIVTKYATDEKTIELNIRGFLSKKIITKIFHRKIPTKQTRYNSIYNITLQIFKNILKFRYPTLSYNNNNLSSHHFEN